MADNNLSATWANTLQQGNQPQANLKRTLLDGNLEEELDTSSKDNKDVIVSSVFLYEDVKYGTQLTDKGIRWTRATEIGRVHFISYMSMIGVKLVRESKNKFVIFYCSKKVGTKERVRAFCNFTSMSGPDEAKQWVQYIRAKIHNIPVNQIPFKKRMTVFVNPAAGDKTALGQWDSVSVMFKIAGIDVNKLETTRKGHAYELAFNLNLMEAMDGIIVAGGNGTVNEVVNGLLARPDWDVARKIPLGVIPASGSGNGLANSLDATDPVTAAYFIIKGTWYTDYIISLIMIASGLTRPLDVFAVIQNQTKMYGVVSVTWCLTSAVEAESEVLRWMGAFRFQLMAFKKVLDNESYSGMLCTAPAENWTETECSDTCSVCRMSLRESEVKPIPPASDTNTNVKEADKPVKESKRSSNDSVERSGSFRRAQYDSDDSEEENKQFDGESQDSEDERSADSEPDDDPNAKPEKVVGPHLEIIPRDFSSWPKGVAGEFMFFTAANVCRTSSKAKVAKWAHLSDGYLDLVVIRKTSRSAMLKILMEIEKGTFVKDPIVEYKKVKAFALIPDPNQAQSVKSLIGVDGERLPENQNSQTELNPQPVQVEVVPALINVFCAPPSQPVIVVKKKFWGLF